MLDFTSLKGISMFNFIPLISIMMLIQIHEITYAFSLFGLLGLPSKLPFVKGYVYHLYHKIDLFLLNLQMDFGSGTKSSSSMLRLLDC